MRQYYILLVLFLSFRVTPIGAAAPPLEGFTPSLKASMESEEEPVEDAERSTAAGFQLFVHRADQAGWVSAGGIAAGGKSADRENVSWACRGAEYRPRRGLPVWIERRRKLYWPALVESACRYGVPIGLYDAVVIAESAYRPTAVSTSGAMGLAQLMPQTAKELGVSNRAHPRQNLDGGARYLRQMLDMFQSHLLAVAAYNAGPGAVRRAGGIPRNDETLGYVRRVMALWQGVTLGQANGS